MIEEEAGRTKETSESKITTESTDVLFELTVISLILEFFEKQQDATFKVKAFLEQFEPEQNDRICNFLDYLVDNEVISYWIRNDLFEGKIEKKSDVLSDLQFGLGENTYGILSYILRRLCCNTIENIYNYKSNIDKINNELTLLKEEQNNIIKSDETIKNSLTDFDRSKEQLGDNIKKFDKEFEQAKELFNNLPNQVTEYTSKNIDNALNEKGKITLSVKEEIDNSLKRDGKIGAFVEQIQKDIMQYMSIFIAIFALLNLNLSNLKPWNIRKFIGINLCLVASMTTLTALLAFILYKPNEKEKNYKPWILSAFAIILWAIIIKIMFYY